MFQAIPPLKNGSYATLKRRHKNISPNKEVLCTIDKILFICYIVDNNCKYEVHEDKHTIFKLANSFGVDLSEHIGFVIEQ